VYDAGPPLVRLVQANRLAMSSAFWDVLAPYHAAIEDNYFDRSAVHAIRHQLREPVLVVGAGQGLVVAEVRRYGLRCDGIDHSAQMVRRAKLRRGLDLIRADARELPLADRSYATVIYPTGVIDSSGDDREIERMLAEGRRVATGDLFVAFYRLGAPLAGFLRRVELLHDGVLDQRACLELYLHDPVHVMRWVARRSGTHLLGATLSLLRLWISSSSREKRMSSEMARIMKQAASARALVEAAPAAQPYRDAAAIRALFRRLAIPTRELRVLESCFIVHA
jgi:multidrug efflux pump subunit AcrA (membrane-fusion protein)